MQQQPFLLTVAYAQGLQYWAEKLNLPVDPDFCPLARSVLELRAEGEGAHVIFTKQDVHPGLREDWPRNYLLVASTHPNLPKVGWIQAQLGPGRCMWPLLRGCTPQFPWPGFKWTTDQLGKMPALLRAVTQTASTTVSGVELTSPIAPPNWGRRGEVVCTSCDCFDKAVKFGDYQCHPQGTQWPPHLEEVLSRIPIWHLFSQDQFQQEGQSATKAPQWRN